MGMIDRDEKTCSFTISPKVEGLNLALKNERRKIYLISRQNEIIYVGEADTSIKEKMRRGITSFNYFMINGKARGGYKGYKWIHPDENKHRLLDVHVSIFESEYDDKRAFIEAVEAELVYLIRNKTGMWPAFQNEIHFQNKPGALETAKAIYSKWNGYAKQFH
jgi:hypothetical protein